MIGRCVSILVGKIAAENSLEFYSLFQRSQYNIASVFEIANGICFPMMLPK